MVFEPLKGDIEYLQQVKKNSKKTANRVLSSESSMILLCSIPQELDNLMQKQYGRSWHSDDRIVTEFMRKNPQYTIARPV